MKKWEYQSVIVVTDEGLIQTADEIGAQGWELIAIVPNIFAEMKEDCTVAYFKRQI